MDSPLEVTSYFFPHVQVTADAEFRPGKGNKIPVYDTKRSITKGDDGSYQVAVEIISEPENEKEKQAYSIQLIVIGLFEVHPDWPDPEKLLRINGASILYSAAREFLITLTSRGPWGAESLPTISFFEKTDTSSQEKESKKTKPAPVKKTPKKQRTKK